LDEWVFVFQGISFPRREGFGYIKDMNGLFIQTHNGSCFYPENNLFPSFPENEILSKALSLNIDIFQTNKYLVYYSDYFPSSFFPLLTDSNPFGASNFLKTTFEIIGLLFRYMIIPFFENKLWDSSGKNPLITIGPKNKDVWLCVSMFIL
jgi:hypothetical protein